MSRPISASYLERKLRAIAGVQGSNPLPELTDLNGLITLESDRPEWAFPGGEQQRSFLTFLGAGGAGVLSVAGLENSPNSGVLAIVERVDVWISVVGAANRAVAAWLNTGILALQGSASRDGRDTLKQLTSAVSFGFVQQTPAFLIANGLNDIDEFGPTGAGGGPNRTPYIVPPGRSLIFYEADTLNARVLNTPLTVAMAWRQRPIEGSVEVR